MPTGYTAGILDGKITTFQQFAIQCMRAFGATIHMRDDSIDAPYTPRTPSTYHQEQIAEANKLLQKANDLSDGEILTARNNELEASKKYHMDAIEKEGIDKKKLESILGDIVLWQPPTSEHTGIKEFMIDQIRKTIDSDCDTSYHFEKLSEIREELSSITAQSVRQNMIDKANNDLQYHTKQHNEELARCAQANKWVEDYLSSLNALTVS